eukprot:50638-Chlamydomonas_euryale.AAC.1
MTNTGARGPAAPPPARGLGCREAKLCSIAFLPQTDASALPLLTSAVAASAAFEAVCGRRPRTPARDPHPPAQRVASRHPGSCSVKAATNNKTALHLRRRSAAHGAARRRASGGATTRVALAC